MTQIMRIAYLINQYPKVSHTFIRREIQALERKGISVMRISVRGWNDPLVDAEDAKERKQTRYVLKGGALPLIVAFFRLLLRHPIRTLRALGLEFRMARHSERPLPVHLIYLAEACQIFLWLKQANISHLHAHFGTNSAEVAMLVHVLGGPPWSFTVHGPEEFDRPHQIGLPEKIRRAAFVVAISSYGRSQLFRLVHHSYWPKIHVVHCGLDHDLLNEAPTRVLPTRRLVCLGRICEQKGQLLLLEAATLLATKGIDFELVLAGDGEMRADAEQFIADHQLASKVRVTGWITGARVRDELLAARALVLPSFAEGLPVVIMEAMALRRPVISTYVAGIPELVEPGRHGWLVPAGDVEALVESMRACLDCGVDLLIAMGDAAHRRVVRSHSIDEEAAKLEQLFRKPTTDVSVESAAKFNS
jgi:colanic acid/amylovoran biosynthesis glycosyltransferase